MLLKLLLTRPVNVPPGGPSVISIGDPTSESDGTLMVMNSNGVPKATVSITLVQGGVSATIQLCVDEAALVAMTLKAWSDAVGFPPMSPG